MRIDGTQMTRIKQMNADRNEPGVALADLAVDNGTRMTPNKQMNADPIEPGVALADLAPWRWIMERG